VVPREDAAALLDRTEKSVLEALPFPEFAALQDWFRDRFRRARGLLLAEAGATQAVRIASISPRAVALFAQTDQGARRTGALADSRGSILSALDRAIEIFENNDERVDVCVRSLPLRGATVDVYPPSYRQGRKQVSTHNRLVSLPRGLYAYEVTLQGYARIDCRPDEDCAKLDLLAPDRPLVECNLAASGTIAEGTCNARDLPSRRWRCEADDP
jgi:hypothetical protein